MKKLFGFDVHVVPKGTLPDHIPVVVCPMGEPSLARSIQFANSSTGHAVAFYNEINIGSDGWAMLTKFGDYPSDAIIPTADGKWKKQRAIQRIDKAGAEAMVASFHNERRGLKKFLRGCNIYRGHPDVPGLEKFYPDKQPKGVIADLEVRDDGLYGLPVFNNEGSELVENPDPKKRLRAFSGNIGESQEDGQSGGLPVYRPTKMFSVGLTNSPHLPVNFFNADDTLADAAEADAGISQTKKQNAPTMNKKLMAVLALLGLNAQFANANEPTANETEAALDQINTKVAAFANEQTSLKKKLLGLCAKVGITFANETQITNTEATLAQVEEKVTTLNTDLTSARTQFANERKARIDEAIADAVVSGRITDAEKVQWQNRLNVEAQFANELNALRKLEAKVKTQSTITVQRSGRDTQIDVSQPQQRAQFLNEALDVVAGELKLDRAKDYDKVFAEVQRRHPALFANMAAPQIKTRK